MITTLEKYEDLCAEDEDFDDDHYCVAPGRGPFGLCVDDMCRGSGVCMYAPGEP